MRARVCVCVSVIIDDWYDDVGAHLQRPMPLNMSTLPAGSGCMASAWYEYISKTLETFMNATGECFFDLLNVLDDTTNVTNVTTPGGTWC